MSSRRPTLSAFRGLDHFEGACQLGTWLHRIVVNTALMRLRSQRRKPEESIEVLLPSFQDDGHHVEQFSNWNVPADELIERKQRERSCASASSSYRTTIARC
jgi:DNA-directed RNA polymerase specialized sigma24 family protein